MRFIYTTVKETVSTCVCKGEEAEKGGGLAAGDGNGKWQRAKSHVKLYLDHDSCRLENPPLVSLSLRAQLL